MLFDLRPNNKMDHIVGLLHATVTDTYLRLKELVRDMTQEEIDYKGPNGDLNSTAQLLRHLAVVDLHWVYRLIGAFGKLELDQAVDLQSTLKK
jgi:hypothetical protein